MKRPASALSYPGIDKLQPLSTAARFLAFFPKLQGGRRCESPILSMESRLQWSISSLPSSSSPSNASIMLMIRSCLALTWSHNKVLKLVDKQAEPPIQSPALVVLLLPPLPLLPCLAPQRRLPSFSFLKHLSAFSSSLSYEEWFMSVCDMSDVEVNPRYTASALVCLQI